MQYRVHVNGKQFDVIVEPVNAVAAGSAPVAPAIPVAPVPAVAARSGEAVPSPFPGTVQQVSVSVGQKVEAGQCLLILEAMKMQNEIAAPRAGVVRQILVAGGASVGTGDVLVILE